MKKHYLAMTSITYAMKAYDFLRRRGIRCEVVRTPKNLGSGCGYSIAFPDEPERVIALLDGAGIPHK
ncbi:MAG: DUF3343 domain-containing protein [Ruminococcus sp.]|nr:DUF3343 domain-containing protein [Ruminococcus sp.]